MTISHEWDTSNPLKDINSALMEYLYACYDIPLNLSEIQLREVRQAFLSGVHWMCQQDGYDPSEYESALRTLLNQPKK